MAAVEFPAPGLDEQQWERVHILGNTLSPAQALWLSGYFAGLSQAMRTDTPALAQAAAPVSALVSAPKQQQRTVTVLFGSETGKAAGLAALLADRARQAGFSTKLTDLASYKPRRLKEEQDVLLITSTHGEGDPPPSAVEFFEYIDSRKASRLEGVRFAVLALGDSSYEQFCAAGKRADSRLEQLGAERLCPRVDCDVDYQQPSERWMAAVVEALAPSPGTAPVPVAVPDPHRAAAAGFDKDRPYLAQALENIVLTGRGSSKETRHLELALGDSGLVFQPGDALGVVPRNDPAVVDALLRELGLDGGERVSVGDDEVEFRHAFERSFEITTATPRFLEFWAKTTASAALRRLCEEGHAAERSAFLKGHHIVDLVRLFPARSVDASGLLSGLRPLQPRLYSIASSLPATPEEVHLTVSTVRYTLHDEMRFGVASGQMAHRVQVGDTLPVFVQSNPNFRMPSNDAPIIMIGGGTGVAPFRAFLQEREARGSGGRSWLFFGERNFRTDFLYQTEWQEHLRTGVLTRMDVAFSRDQSAKYYVQGRLRERGREIYDWLQTGAHVYVCGDAAGLAPGVDQSLRTIISEHGGLDATEAKDYLRKLQHERRYQKDVY